MLTGHQRQSLLFVLLLQKRVQKEGNPTTDSTMPCSPLLFRRMQTAEEGVIQPPKDHTHGGRSSGSAIGTGLGRQRLRTAMQQSHHVPKLPFLHLPQLQARAPSRTE